VTLKGAPAVNLNRARRFRRDFLHFASLIATPETSGAVTLPASGRLFFVATDDCAADTPVAEVVGPTTKTFLSPEMVAGDRIEAGFIERDSVVTMEAGFELHVQGPFGVTSKIFGEA
jgi:hypothetical protein